MKKWKMMTRKMERIKWTKRSRRIAILVTKRESKNWTRTQRLAMMKSLKKKRKKYPTWFLSIQISL